MSNSTTHNSHSPSANCQTSDSCLKRPLDASSGKTAEKRLCLANFVNPYRGHEVGSPVVATSIPNREEEDPAPEVSSPVVNDIQMPSLLLREWMCNWNRTHPVVHPDLTGSKVKLPLAYNGQTPIPGSNDLLVFVRVLFVR
jgi:hypothetical protein